MVRIQRSVVMLLFLLAFITPSPTSAQGSKTSVKLDKIPIEDLVAKHISSIGSARDIAGIRSLIMMGEGRLESKRGSAFTLGGAAQFVSEEKRVLFAMSFDSSVYPYERVAFDGTSQTFGLPSGKTTVLGAFLRAQGSILKDGLFGGTLSHAWTLTNLESQDKPKLEHAGTAEIDGQPCYKLKYSSKRTGELRVTMYFDGKSFRHLRTEYEYTIEPRIGTSSTDIRGSSRVVRFSMQEDFTDFRTAGKLTLPFHYSITVETPGTVSREWTLKIETVHFDQEIGAHEFRVS